MQQSQYSEIVYVLLLFSNLHDVGIFKIRYNNDNQ